MVNLFLVEEIEKDLNDECFENIDETKNDNTLGLFKYYYCRNIN